MRKVFIYLFLISGFLVSFSVEGKKIKNSFKIEKELKNGKETIDNQEGRMEYSVGDSLLSQEAALIKEKIKFSGFEKEVNSAKETFLIVNESDECLTGFTVRIDYLDMKGRMLHSREISEECFVPEHETRKIDIPAWDLQHTYYYYLGNEPKKVATPFQVNIKPLFYRISPKIPTWDNK